MGRWFLLIIIAVAAFIAAGVGFWQNRELRESSAKYTREWAHVQRLYDSLQVAHSDLAREASEARRSRLLEEVEDLARLAVMLDSSEIRRLEKAGLTDPVAQLRRDLMSNPELIPFPGMHGGRMGFYDESGIVLLDRPWVFARFDDGHIQGSCLLEYAITPDTTIRWTVMKAQLWKP